MKTSIFRGDLNDISATKATLPAAPSCGFVEADTSVGSPGNLFPFTLKKTIYGTDTS